MNTLQIQLQQVDNAGNRYDLDLDPIETEEPASTWTTTAGRTGDVRVFDLNNWDHVDMLAVQNRDVSRWMLFAFRDLASPKNEVILKIPPGGLCMVAGCDPNYDTQIAAADDQAGLEASVWAVCRNDS
jgi:hypothetical protein